MEECSIGDRWVSNDLKVWENRPWGWKFLGTCKSRHFTDIVEIPSNDCDHPLDVIIEDSEE